MNHLTKVLLEDLLGDGKKKITAIYGGGFKPPTKGHFDVVQKAAEQNPEIDDIIIYVGGGERNGIGQGESIQIWEIYKKYLPMKVRIEPSKAPIGDILRYAKDHPEEEVLWIIGARENNPEDFADISSRTRTLDKYPNLELRVIQTKGGVSGTAARKAVKDNNKQQFLNLIPDIDHREQDQIWNIVSPIIKEGIMDDIKPKFQKFLAALKQEGQETKEVVGLLVHAAQGKIKLSDKDKEYIGNQLKDILKTIGLVGIAALPGGFIAGALIKLFKAEHLITPSSMMNELVTDTEVICDNCGWEWPIADGGDDLYICHKCGHDNNPNLEEGRKKKSDPKKGTGKKPEGSGRRLYTDEDPKDTVRIKFKTKEDIVDTLNKTSFKAKSHARQSQVINLIHQRVRAAYGKAKDPEVKSRLKRALDYIEKRKEMSKKKTERLRKLKEFEGDSNPLNLPHIDTWHDGQYKAQDGKTEEAIKLMTKAADEAEKYAKENQDGGVAGEAGYYRGTIAWLKKDYTTVEKYINDKYVKITGNDEVLKRLLKNKDKSYKEAYSLKEMVTATEVICDNCGWEWKKADGGDDLYICHKCGHDNNPALNESLKETWKPEESFVSLSKYMIDNGMNIKPLPKIKVISDDKDNASNLLGKTAYYNPADKSITLYTMDRHPKDILRSFAHEMIHHEQNLDGKLNNINTTNTNEDGTLPEIEREAYEKGNMMLRNWEDSIKNV